MTTIGMTGKTIGLSLIVSLGLWAGSASAQNLDLDEVGALLALPIITGDARDDETNGDAIINGAATAITITNAGAEVRLHVNVISGDPGDNWESGNFNCYLTASETALFVFESDGAGGSLVSFECDEEEVSRSPYKAANGIMVVTLEDPITGQTVNTNQIFGDAVVLDGAGYAYSVGAIPFQGVVPGAGTADRKYRFDNIEYSEFPSALATNFIAPSGPQSANLVLFTLDGTVGSFNPPEAKVDIMFYNDDEVPGSAGHAFDCFDIVSLTDIDGRFDAAALGSPVGHMVLTPAPVTYSNLAHDATFDGGLGSVVGVRTPPVHGWIFQTEPGRAWGRTLFQSQLPVVASAGDTPVLNGR